MEVEVGHDSWKEPFSTKPVGGTVNWVNLFSSMYTLDLGHAGSLADALEGLQRDLNDEQICGRRVDGTAGSGCDAV